MFRAYHNRRGEIQETRISWELLLEVINNPLSPPVFMESVVEYAA
jgi:hypothetical protein